MVGWVTVRDLGPVDQRRGGRGEVVHHAGAVAVVDGEQQAGRCRLRHLDEFEQVVGGGVLAGDDDQETGAVCGEPDRQHFGEAGVVAWFAGHVVALAQGGEGVDGDPSLAALVRAGHEDRRGQGGVS